MSMFIGASYKDLHKYNAKSSNKINIAYIRTNYNKHSIQIQRKSDMEQIIFQHPLKTLKNVSLRRKLK